MNTKPFISIIIPVHNTAKYLDRCIRSVQNQTLNEIEIIMVNNCSTDNSLNICQNYAQEDNRIKLSVLTGLDCQLPEMQDLT